MWASFFEFAEIAPVDDGDAGEVADALVDLLAAAATFEDHGRVFDRSLADDARTALDRLAGRVPADDVALMRSHAAEVLIESTADAQPLHGDPHRRNVARRADGELVWFDLDDGVRDAPLVDLATLTLNRPEAGRVACARLGVDPAGPEMARYLAQRRLWGDLWTLYYASEVGGAHVARAAAVLAERRR